MWAAYDEIFGDQPDIATWRANMWDRHVARDGFRLATAVEDGRVLGFAYGYTGERGQWWPDAIAAVWPEELVAEWLGGHFELVSVGVVSAARGHGLGRRLLSTLCDGLPHERWLLMATADESDPARALYASLGWEVVGPGLSDESVVLGRRNEHWSAHPRTAPDT